MPPKSASKREQVLWYLCEKCKANITSKEREQHDDVCPLDSIDSLTRFSFVRGGVLHSNQLNAKPITEDIRDLTAKQLNGLVFLSESVINLCGFVLGDQVLIHTPQSPAIAPIVRSVWPTPNSFLTTVFVSEEGKKLIVFVCHFLVQIYIYFG